MLRNTCLAPGENLIEIVSTPRGTPVFEFGLKCLYPQILVLVLAYILHVVCRRNAKHLQGLR